MTSTEAFSELHHELTALYNDREAGNIADWVVERITGRKRWQRKTEDLVLTPDQRKLYLRYKSELLQNKPVQYVLNEAWFCGMKFMLNEHVLIPRPETEELVSLIARENIHKDPLIILDIGSGSGCIPIGLKSKISHARISSVDISMDAVHTARLNAQTLNVDVAFDLLDFLDEDTWPKLGQFDVIVSNPPYIPATEKALLDKHVVDFEPGVALFVPADDPFIFYRKIARFAAGHLRPKGKIYLEVHENYAREVAEIYAEGYAETRLVHDMYGKERMIVVEQ